VVRALSSRFYYGWVVVAASLVVNVASSPLNAGVFSFFVTPMSEDLGWSRGELSWAFTWRLVVAGLSAPLLGAMIDRHGPRVLGAFAGTIAGLSLLGFASMNQLWVFYAIAAVSGLSGFGAPSGQLLTTVPVAKWFVANRGRALAIATVGLPLGTAVLIPVTQLLIDNVGWRETWAIGGIYVMALSVPACAVFMRKDPSAMGLHPDGVDPTAPVRESLDERDTLVTDEDWTVRQVLRSRTLWIILASMALTSLVLPGTVVYRVSFWEDVGLSANTVAFATALDPLTVTFSTLIFGFVAERVQTRYLGFIGGAGVGVSMLFMAFATDALWMLLAYNITWGLTIGAYITVNNIIWPNYYGTRFLGTIRGIVFPVSVATAAISAPLYATLLNIAPDERYVWGVTCAAFVIAGLLLLIAKPPRLEQPHPA
jgi:sugar phosphate permease